MRCELQLRGTEEKHNVLVLGIMFSREWLPKRASRIKNPSNGHFIFRKVFTNVFCH